MSTVATTQQGLRAGALRARRFERPGSTRALLIAWVFFMAFVSLALALL
ncbi:hypothetical protein [Nocardia sp. NPDC003963]